MFNHAFVDWDDTVYNTVALKADIFDIFTKHGATEKDILDTFRKSLCTIAPHQYDYTFEEHTQFLRDRGYNLPNTVEEELNSLFYKDYLFSDTGMFLQFLKSISNKVILLSAGDKKFQMSKINDSGIVDIFDEVVVLSGGKEKYLGENYSNDKIFFVNDNLRENLSVKQEVPSALVVTKLNAARYSEEEAGAIGAPYFKTLSEIKQYVEQQVK